MIVYFSELHLELSEIHLAISEIHLNYLKFIWLFLKFIWTIWNSFRIFWIRPELSLDISEFDLKKGVVQKLICNSWGKHKGNQYHDGDFIPDKTYWILMNIGFYIKLSS